ARLALPAVEPLCLETNAEAGTNELVQVPELRPDAILPTQKPRSVLCIGVEADAYGGDGRALRPRPRPQRRGRERRGRSALSIQLGRERVGAGGGRPRREQGRAERSEDHLGLRPSAPQPRRTRTLCLHIWMAPYNILGCLAAGLAPDAMRSNR